MAELSLLDTQGMKVREWWVVYYPRTPHFSFTKLLKQGFRHVDLWRPLPYGPGADDVGWLRVDPCFEMLDADVDSDPTPPHARFPGATVQRVTAMRPFWSVRSWFDAGPTSCVEVVKLALGIRAFWVRTPFQLFRYIQKRNGVIISGRRRRGLRPDKAAGTAANATGAHECEPQP